MRRHETSLRGALWSLIRTPIPPERRGYLALGWLIMVLFGIQLATGILLSLYYEASPATAAASVRVIMRDVDSGWLVRGIHHWNATAIVAVGILQLFRILLAGTYRGRGAASWFIGCFLLVITFAEAFTGEVLPWDNEAYWTLVQTFDSIERMPLVGPGLAAFLRGGAEVTGYTLGRAHAAHVLLLPWIAIVLVTVHLWLFARRRLGGTD